VAGLFQEKIAELPEDEPLINKAFLWIPAEYKRALSDEVDKKLKSSKPNEIIPKGRRP
jgi:hypothetical protein